MRLAITIAVLVVGAASAAADAGDDRKSYVRELTQAVQSASPEERAEVQEALFAGARTRCRAAFGKPTVRCLLAMAKTTCGARPADRQRACMRIADVVITNQLAESEWIDKSTRVRLMNSADDFRAAMNRELSRRYAPLAAEMSLAPDYAGGPELGPSIDRFCVRYTTKRRLTWQRCVAALVWYAATTRESPTARGSETP